MYLGRCLLQLTQQTLSRQRVVQPNARAMLQLLYLSLYHILTSKIAACSFCYQHLIPTKAEHILMNQFWRELPDHCFCSNGIPLSHSHEATPSRLLVGCQALPSRTHARSCFTTIL